MLANKDRHHAYSEVKLAAVFPKDSSTERIDEHGRAVASCTCKHVLHAISISESAPVTTKTGQRPSPRSILHNIRNGIIPAHITKQGLSVRALQTQLPKIQSMWALKTGAQGEWSDEADERPQEEEEVRAVVACSSPKYSVGRPTVGAAAQKEIRGRKGKHLASYQVGTTSC